MIAQLLKLFRPNTFICFFLGIIIFLSNSSIAQQTIPLYLNDKLAIDIRVENALSLMTLEEKVGLCHAQSKFSSGGVPRLGIPELTMSDGPHGIRAEMKWDKWEYAGWTSDSCTAFPSLNCLAASWNSNLAYQYGKAIGEEARYRNKSVLLGPGVNIYRTPLNGRNFEYMGEDPKLASVMAVPYIKGVQTNGVAACLKHYMANNQETLRDSINVEMSDRAMYEIYAPAFKAAVIEGGAMAVMGAYNKFRGEFCNENSFLLNQTLKKNWGFNGVVISDWNGVHSTQGAAKGGVDIEMGTEDGKDFSEYYLANPFLNKLKSGKIDIKVVNDKASRILKTIFLTSMNKSRPFGYLGGKNHTDLSAKIAEQGIVLLKNEQNILPLNIKTLKTLAIIGDNATRKQLPGGGSSELKAKYEISPLQGLVNRLSPQINVQYAQGYSLKPEEQEQLKKEAIELAAKSDIIIFVGGLNKELGQDCESIDRQNMELPYGQNEM
ncbi:MAG: glycoside hydrolase family 3 protein, partial [Pedobacter sp.]|nr:glycoside hydrolase family 3 protein [Pedobacter sp.]